jgi:hypothetical protein
MRKFTKRSAAITAAAVIAVGGGGAAFAAASGWFDGKGTANAASAEIKPVTVEVTPAGKLWPNKAVDATINFGNYNEYPVKPTNVNTSTALDVKVFDADGTTPTDPSACSAANASLSLGNFTPVVVDPGTFKQISATGFVGMGPNAPITCANKIFKITFKVDGEIA